MNDEYNEYNEYDDPEGFGYKPSTTELYFLKGTYKIRLNRCISTSGSNSQFSAEIIRTEIEDDNAPSIMDVFELLDKTFFLEFLAVMLGQCGINMLNKTHKLLRITDDDSKIYVTAELTTDQKLIHWEDGYESDNQSTDIIYLNGTPVVRTQQNYYGITQSIKYCILNYTVFDNDNFDWDHADWYLIYETLVEPYIKLFLNAYLKLNQQIKNVYDYKNYMTLHVQFCSMRTDKTLYLEIYTLPQTVYGHDIIYDTDNGRVIMINTKNNNSDEDLNSMSSDMFRICAGTQNLNLLPVNNTNIYSLFLNGSPHLVLNEISLDDELYENYFLLPRYQHSLVDSRNILRVDQVTVLPKCPFEITMSDNSIMDSTVQYLAFFTPNNENQTVIETSDTSMILGVICFEFNNVIDSNLFINNIINTNEKSFLPWSFLNTITAVAGLYVNKSDKYVLLPIRALPKYREYMLMLMKSDKPKAIETKAEESHPNIIDKKENTVVHKKKPFKFWSRGD